MNKKITLKINRTVIFRLWQYIFKHKWMLLAALLLTVVSNILSLLGPMLSGFAIDAIEPGKDAVDFNRVFYFTALMVIFYLISAVLSYCMSVLMINLSRKVIFKMRKDVFEKLLDLPVGYFDKYKTGDIISRLTYDIDTINASLSHDLIQICTSFITVFGSLFMMILISPVLVLIFALTIPASLLLTRYMTKRVRPLFKKRSAKLGELNGYVEEIISGQKTIKAYHQEATMTERFDVKNEEAVKAYYNAQYHGSMVGPSINFINNLSLSFITVFGAILYLFGNLSLGNVSSFVLYSRRFSGPINEMANILSELQSSTAAAERIFRILDEEPERDSVNAEKLYDVHGDVRMEHVKFGYNKDDIVIHNLSLDIPKGKLIAIVGPTGAGKTTVANLLMRFYDPQGGIITLDAANIKAAKRDSLRKSYAMVLQDTWLFHGTVFDNIAYGKEDATMEEVINAAKAAKIHNYITQLPKGYHTVLNEDGLNISQGQKQLLTIARAMLLDSKMLILDEATSNVDTQTELKIQQAMRNLMRDKTCFVIAHRLSTVQNADNILVIKDGDIVEQGTHKELLEMNGFYAELYYSQFEVN